MIVPDGETVFVGGLIKHRVDESKSGVPVVSRIPGVGRLFSKRNNTTTNTETIVLITPTVVARGESMIDQDTLDKIDDLEQDQLQEGDNLDREMDLFFGSTTRSTE